MSLPEHLGYDRSPARRNNAGRNSSGGNGRRDKRRDDFGQFRIQAVKSVRHQIVIHLIVGQLDLLLEAAGVNLMLQTRATRLVMNEDGSVAGVVAEQDGAEILIEATRHNRCLSWSFR